MKHKEKQLIFYLNYKPNSSDVFIRSEAILWFQNKFMQYWEKVDKETSSNNVQVIKELYLNSRTNRTIEEIADSVGLHIRTLTRYRDKFLAKMKDLIHEYKNLRN